MYRHFYWMNSSCQEFATFSQPHSQSSIATQDSSSWVWSPLESLAEPYLLAVCSSESFSRSQGLAFFSGTEIHAHLLKNRSSHSIYGLKYLDRVIFKEMLCFDFKKIHASRVHFSAVEICLHSSLLYSVGWSRCKHLFEMVCFWSSMRLKWLFHLRRYHLSFGICKGMFVLWMSQSFQFFSYSLSEKLRKWMLLRNGEDQTTIFLSWVLGRQEFSSIAAFISGTKSHCFDTRLSLLWSCCDT